MVNDIIETKTEVELAKVEAGKEIIMAVGRESKNIVTTLGRESKNVVTTLGKEGKNAVNNVLWHTGNFFSNPARCEQVGVLGLIFSTGLIIYSKYRQNQLDRIEKRFYANREI